MVFKAGYRRLPKELIDYIWNYDNRYKLLFKKPTNIASSALIPLNTKKPYGFLAIGSRDAKRFNPSMSMDYLSLIGTLISHSIERDIL